MKHLIYKEWTLAIRQLHELLQPVFFLLILITLFPIAIGSEPKVLSQLAPPIIWVGVLLSILLSSEKLYKNDFEDGSLEQLFLSGHSKLASVYAKLLVQWVLQILPIILSTPLLALLYQLPFNTLWVVVLTLLIGSPSLLLLAMLGSSITLSIRRSGLLLILIILPLYIPTLIFAISAVTNHVGEFNNTGQLAILGAILALTLTIIPFAIIATIKASLAES